MQRVTASASLLLIPLPAYTAALYTQCLMLRDQHQFFGALPGFFCHSRCSVRLLLTQRRNPDATRGGENLNRLPLSIHFHAEVFTIFDLAQLLGIDLT
ncbi:hypothetical protein FHW71_000427 [Enterobacter sp. Sphag1F]|nr:hypothetical protein [Enterobacter sp. Sphag1F]NYI12971.1 hypothetical protein [Enterobacter sp. Sphag71]